MMCAPGQRVCTMSHLSVHVTLRCALRLIDIWFIHMLWHMYRCDRTCWCMWRDCWYLWHDAVLWLMYMCTMIQARVRRDWFICVLWHMSMWAQRPIHMCPLIWGMSHKQTIERRCESCASSVIDMCAMTHMCVSWVTDIRRIWRAMTKWCVCHDSVIWDCHAVWQRIVGWVGGKEVKRPTNRRRRLNRFARILK